MGNLGSSLENCQKNKAPCMVDLRDSLGSVPLLDSVKSGLCNINSHRICTKTDETLSDCLKMENTIIPFLHQRSVSAAYYHMIKYFV